MYDVAIIGAGITGCFIARELCRYDLKVVLLEKDSDVANGTTKANSAIVHSGYDAYPGTLKAKFNSLGNPLFDDICCDLDVPFKRIGSLTIALDENELGMLSDLYMQGIVNNIPELEILTGEQVRRIEPNINDEVIGALYAGSAGVVDSFGLAIALAENAVDNGVEIRLDSQVTGIERLMDGYRLAAGGNVAEAKYVINCGGVFAHDINDMISPAAFKITPRKGEYIIFDKKAGELVKHVIFQCPSAKGKGVLVSPTVHGNLLIGPDSQDVYDKGDVATTPHGLEMIREMASRSVNKVPFNMAITNFAGLRATPDTGDFIIGELEGCKGFINVAGIESPGLTASPAIAVYVTEILRDRGLVLKANPAFNPKRRPVVKFAALTDEQKYEITKKDPSYGRIICRCEEITEGEIVDAIRRNVGARSVDGVKRRVRAGMGRCQGGFCGPRIIEILARELEVDYCRVIKGNSNSHILTSQTKTGYSR